MPSNPSTPEDLDGTPLQYMRDTMQELHEWWGLYGDRWQEILAATETGDLEMISSLLSLVVALFDELISDAPPEVPRGQIQRWGRSRELIELVLQVVDQEIASRA